VIRVFDLTNEKEQAALIDSQLDRNKVTALDIWREGKFLVAGHKNGYITLWDLERYRLVKVCKEAHFT